MKGRKPAGRAAAGAAAALALVAVALLVGIATRPSHASTAVPATLPGELTGPAPWSRNTDMLRARLASLNLPALNREGTRLHIHVHLDVFVDGMHVTVPAGVGIDPALQFISPLHTHDGSGIIHVESPTIRPFTLGEVLGVWGVRFRGGCLGGYCAGGGRSLHVWVNGRPVSSPSDLPLAAHQEIVIAYGTARQLPRPVPAQYAFPFGL